MSRTERCKAIEDEVGQILKNKNLLSSKEREFILHAVEELVSFAFEPIQEGVAKELQQLRQEVQDVKNEIRRKVERQENQIKSDKGKKTYANIAQQNREVTLIVPKLVQEHKKTKDDCKKVINPTELKIGIQGVKTISRGGIIVTCKNKEDNERLTKEFAEKLGKNYDVKKGEFKNPRIKIVDMMEELGEEELTSSIKNQNQELNINDVIKVVKIWKSNSNKFNAILEVYGESYERIMKKGKININWDRCRVFEDIPVFRCYKCYGYNHKAAVCRNQQCCQKCGEEGHKREECKGSAPKCNNCVSKNNKLNMNLDTNHGPLDSECGVYKRQLQLARNKINYK
jgi:hypothetical protein